jgi:prostatic aicd phosphatase
MFYYELILLQIYDHVNVQYTYNKTYYEILPPTFLEQARNYANWVQRNVFTDSTQNAVGQSQFISGENAHY